MTMFNCSLGEFGSSSTSIETDRTRLDMRKTFGGTVSGKVSVGPSHDHENALDKYVIKETTC